MAIAHARPGSVGFVGACWSNAEMEVLHGHPQPHPDLPGRGAQSQRAALSPELGTQPHGTGSLSRAEAGEPLSAAQRERYARHLTLPEIGEAGQLRLLASRVLVVGAGGLGSPVLAYLVAAGVGHVSVVDDDVVSASNLQRQVLFDLAEVGESKVQCAVRRLSGLNPDVQVIGHARRLDADCIDEFVAGQHLVLDGSDNFSTRYLVADACVRAGVPEVFGSVLGFDGQVSVFWPGRGPSYRDVFAEPPLPDRVPSCSEAGVLGAVCGLVGSTMAAEALKILAGLEPGPLGRMLVLDALTMSWRSVPFRSAVADESVPAGQPETAVPARSAGLAGPSAPVIGSASRNVTDEFVDPRDLNDVLKAGAQLLDVRTAAEARQISIPGSVHIELDELLVAVSSGTAVNLSPELPIVVYCHSGSRSRRAAAALRAAGYGDVRELSGGVSAWSALVGGAGGLDDYAEAVLEVVESIPAGKVLTYGDVAELVGRGGPRGVGGVMSRYGSSVAWWRVLRAGGLPPQGHQEQALAAYRAEGTPLRGERVWLSQARWDGRP